uniref:Uncharacterized protein n=1 Tax=Arundo donax TaxID=35708 RepID=A0A0A9D944_ARUDO
MFFVSCRTFTRDQSGEFIIAASIILECVPPSITGSIYCKSPPRTTTFPPNGMFSIDDGLVGSKSRSVLYRVSNVFLWVINASSHIISDVDCINSASIIPCLIHKLRLLLNHKVF